jgi:UDP-N-acetylmuramyl pentapeptide phosphotransferase/UDP-N-acetylglucosamine-1-phosphate transferase
MIFIVMLSLVVFNFFNFRTKAKCFAGDVGAVSIAFIILFLIGLLMIKTHDFSYIILLVVYGIDSILTIVHRIILKEKIFYPHRKHVYQIMANELKIPHIMVSSFYALLQGVIIYLYFIFKSYSYWYLAIVIVFLSVLYLLFKLKYFHKTEETEDRNLKVRNGGKK